MGPPHSILSSSQWEILIPFYPLLSSMWAQQPPTLWTQLKPLSFFETSTFHPILYSLKTWSEFMRTHRPIPSSIGHGFVYRFSWMTKYFLSFFHFQILTSPASVTAFRESYLLVSVISWVRLQSGNNQKSVSALHTTVSDSVTFCSVVYIYCFGKCLGLLCQLHCHVLKIRSKIVGGSAIDFEFLMPTTDGAKRVRYGWKFWMFTESQCFNRATTWQTFERLCCDLEQNATKRKSKQASKQSEK